LVDVVPATLWDPSQGGLNPELEHLGVRWLARLGVGERRCATGSLRAARAAGGRQDQRRVHTRRPVCILYMFVKPELSRCLSR
jgi:hypothetical protein